MIQYLKNVLIWLDQGVNVIIFRGYPDQTLSARAWRHSKNGERVWLQNVLPEFVDTRLMPSAPTTMKWILGGSTFLILSRADAIIAQYLPMMKMAGLVNDNNQLDIELTKGFINSAFAKSGNITMYGFTFDKSDGEALIGILEKYKDE